MTYKHPTWMELMKEEPALWESVVQYGQFQSIPLFIQKIKEDVQLQEGEDEEEDEDAAEKEAEAVEEEMPIMLERNYLAGWIGVMILALYLSIEETIFGV